MRHPVFFLTAKEDRFCSNAQRRVDQRDQTHYSPAAATAAPPSPPPPPLLLPDCPTTFISFLHFLWSYGGNSVAFTTLAILYFMYCTGPIWTVKFENCPPMGIFKDWKTRKYCKLEYFKIIQCKVRDHTLNKILFYCYTANCTNEKN